MSLSVGIVGFPNVGKSTLFQTITKKQVDISNYPFCTIEPNVGVVAVPDERVDKLAELMNAENKIYAPIKFVDIAGLIKGSHKGEGLGNKFLAEIRETDAIIYILRAFSKENIPSVLGKVNPLEEKEVLDTELIMKDLETVEKRIEHLEKEAKRGIKEITEELEIFKKTKKLLEEGKVLLEEPLEEEEKLILKNYQLLTIKPRLYLLNGKEKEVSSEVLNVFKKNNWPFLIIDLLEEFEAVGLTKEERITLGLPARDELDLLIKEAYKLLNLITFFTILKPNEVRAWTLKKGEKVLEAAEKIHSDFKKNFICAEIINWKDLIETGGLQNAKEKGVIRTEGKEYIVQDGDVVIIKHSA